MAPPDRVTQPSRPDGPLRREVRRLRELFGRGPLSLRDYYEAGALLQSLAADSAVAARGTGWRRLVAGQVGQSASTLTKCLQFRTRYAEADLPVLEELGVTWAEVTVLAAVESRRERLALLRESQRLGWGQRGLQLELQRRRGRQHGGGRPRRKPRSHGPAADLRELVRLTEAWLRFHDGVWAPGRADYDPAGGGSPPPDELIGQALKAANLLADLSTKSRAAAVTLRKLSHAMPKPV